MYSGRHTTEFNVLPTSPILAKSETPHGPRWLNPGHTERRHAHSLAHLHPSRFSAPAPLDAADHRTTVSGLLAQRRPLLLRRGG